MTLALLPTAETATFVKRARAKLKLTQAEFAEQLGLERRSIVRYERGGFLPPTVQLAIKHLLRTHKDTAKMRRARGAEDA